MITNCVYSVNNRKYSENSYVITDHKYKQYKTIRLQKSPLSRSLMHVNLLISDTLEDDIENLYSETHLCYIIAHDIPENIKNMKLPINVKFTNVNEGNNIMPLVKITKSSMKDIIGTTINISEIFTTFSENNVMIRNFITYEYVGFDISETINLVYSEEYTIQDQIISIINYQSRLESEASNDSLKRMIKRLSHTYNNYLCDHGTKDIYAIHCILYLETLHFSLIKNICGNNTLTDILFNKQISINTPSYMQGKKIENYYKIRDIYQTKNLVTNIEPNEILDEQYISYMSYDSLSDCFADNKCFCILIDSHITETSLKLVNCYPTFITNIDILRSHIMFIDEYKEFDNSPRLIRCIHMGIHGSGNHGLPIYINEEHWKISKCHVEEFVSLASSGCSFTFDNSMLKIYYNALYKVISNINSNAICINLALTLLNLIMTIRKIGEDETWHISMNANISYDEPNFIMHMINYFIYDCSDNSSYFENACIINIKKNVYKFDCRKKHMFKTYDKNRNKIIEYATKHQDSIEKLNKLCNMKTCIEQLLQQFIENNGLITIEMLQIFRNTYKSMNDISFNKILYSIDKRTSEHSEKSLIDNLLLRC